MCDEKQFNKNTIRIIIFPLKIGWFSIIEIPDVSTNLNCVFIHNFISYR